VSTYTMAYSLCCSNQSVADMEVALSNAPRDMDTETLLGLTADMDTTTSAGIIVTRTIIVTVPPGPNPPGLLLGNPQTGQALTNFYTDSFSDVCCTPVKAAAVVFTP
jgi:hypothetical protein